jgi:hypothetical protein
VRDPDEVITGFASLIGSIETPESRQEVLEVIFHLADILERSWFPDRTRTSAMRKFYKSEHRNKQFS